MKIADVALLRLSGTAYREAEEKNTPQAHPIDIYPGCRPTGGPRRRGERPLSALYVEIRSDAGESGIFGPIERTQAFIIAEQLRPFLLDRDPLATEALLDQMLRLDRHGRSGLFTTAVSAIDCALWDLKGKCWQQPLYRLLGGPTRAEVPAYASMLGFDVEPEAAAATALEYQQQGYEAQKWFFRYGPAHGAEGFEKNIAMATAVREALGPQCKIMFDAFMGWDLNYATRMVRALEPLQPTWMEEPIPPERVNELRKLRQVGRVPIATGEHVFTRWQTKELLLAEAVDFLQNDPDWTGGVTELVKICALASAFEVPFVAHGHSLLAALHVAASQSPATVPMVEYLVRYQPDKQHFHQPFLEPRSGALVAPDLPGLGLGLDEDKIEKCEEIQF